ncbi:hypothetical protein JB92DRAFT_2833333 [Gautieria morchelliformis]|nr:hypothetical protein JB92DRAFT_2833333 [Gautieria morchelliformis]
MLAIVVRTHLIPFVYPDKVTSYQSEENLTKPCLPYEVVDRCLGRRHQACQSPVAFNTINDHVSTGCNGLSSAILGHAYGSIYAMAFPSGTVNPYLRRLDVHIAALFSIQFFARLSLVRNVPQIILTGRVDRRPSIGCARVASAWHSNPDRGQAKGLQPCQISGSSKKTTVMVLYLLRMRMCRQATTEFADEAPDGTCSASPASVNPVLERPKLGRSITGLIFRVAFRM